MPGKVVMKHSVTVVDYGIVNLKNIVRGLEKVGGDVKVCDHPSQIEAARRVVLPGVGAFQSGIEELRNRGFDEAVSKSASKGIPILGICLGMQLFMDESFEHGHSSGLGLIPGAVEVIPSMDSDGRKRKVPHIGWSELTVPKERDRWTGTCLEPLHRQRGAYCYFVHSYMVRAKRNKHILAECIYQELPIVAAVQSENVTGLQFHPERSGPVGLHVLEAFVNLV